MQIKFQTFSLAIDKELEVNVTRHFINVGFQVYRYLFKARHHKKIVIDIITIRYERWPLSPNLTLWGNVGGGGGGKISVFILFKMINTSHEYYLLVVMVINS